MIILVRECTNSGEIHHYSTICTVMLICHHYVHATDDILVVRNMLSMLSLDLECEIDLNVPQPIPPPLLSWFKDGELVSSAEFGQIPEFSMSFLTANPNLMPGVFDIDPLQIMSDGTLMLTTRFTNISFPIASGNLPPDTTLEQARELLFSSFLGNWMCFVNNSIGSSSVEYVVTEYGTRLLFILFFH